MLTAMGSVYICQVNICDYVGINNHEGLMVPKISHILNSAACTEYLRLVTGCDWKAIIAGSDESLDLTMQMMGVNYYRFTTGLLEFSDDNIQQGTAGNRK
jgi:hypothetical protein